MFLDRNLYAFWNRMTPVFNPTLNYRKIHNICNLALGPPSVQSAWFISLRVSNHPQLVNPLQVGPLPVIHGVINPITSISRAKCNPSTSHVFSAMLQGWKLYISPQFKNDRLKKQGEPENPKDKPDTRKPIFNVRLVLRVHFVIWVTISTWESKRTSNGNLLPSISRIRLSCVQLIRLLFFSNRHHTLKNRQNTQK